MTATLTEPQIHDRLEELPDWTFENDTIYKQFKFKSFEEAVSFIVRISLHCVQQNHHPEIYNVYNQVKITLNTHDAGHKVTERDIKLAKTIESINWT
jgi:4a-hydroxytetrahydrobiopterin dehydratase